MAKWYSLHTEASNVEAFSLIDVIPYAAAKEDGIFKNPEAEAAYPDEVDTLFILRLSAYEGMEKGIGMGSKINILHQD